MCVYSTVYGFLRPLYSIAQVDIFIGPTSWNRNSRHGPSHPSSQQGKSSTRMDDGVERATHSLSIVCLSFRLHIFFLLLLLFLISSAYFFELGKVIFFAVGYARITRGGASHWTCQVGGFAFVICSVKGSALLF